MKAVICIGLLLLQMLVFSGIASAKYITKPPSIALRTEVSYVSVVDYKGFIEKKNKQSELNFVLVKDLHNSSNPSITIVEDTQLAKQLQINTRYIIAYKTLEMVKVNGVKKYISLKRGAQLLSEQGAEPAIFRYNELLEKQLTSSPSLMVDNVKELKNTIFNGLESTDPKIKEFFVREIVNWSSLQSDLSSLEIKCLKATLLSSDNSTGVLVAMLENRPNLQQKIGLKLLGEKALSLLRNIPVKFETNGSVPNLILNILNYVESHSIASYEDFQRWTHSNVSVVVEFSLLAMKKIDKSKTLEYIQANKDNTFMKSSVRRVFERLARNK